MKSYIDELDRNIFNFVEYEGYDDRYPSLSMQAFSSDFYDEIRHASRRLFQIFCKAAKVFQMAPDDFARNMDMPENLIPYLHKSNALGLPTWLSRFDFVLDVNGNLRMVELNADTPCFLIESYYANEIAGRKHPNKACREELRIFLKRMYNAVLSAKYGRDVYESMIANGGCPSKEPFVFSCFHDYFEDYGTTQFLMNELKSACPEADTRFLSFYDMKIDDEVMILDEGLDLYAAQTNIDKYGNRILIGWMRMPSKPSNEEWIGMMTLPRKITVRKNQVYFSIPDYINDKFNKKNRYRQI